MVEKKIQTVQTGGVRNRLPAVEASSLLIILHLKELSPDWNGTIVDSIDEMWSCDVNDVIDLGFCSWAVFFT
jgi:hypothetical protein